MPQDPSPKIRVTEELINFGEVLPEVNEILQRGVGLYRRDPAAADTAFREALALAPDQLPTYLCLYKIHTYQGNLDEALAIARAGLAEATRQAGLDPDWQVWQAAEISDDVNGPGHFALYTMKALAFIHLRRDEGNESRRYLDKLADLGAMETVGGSVIEALSAGVA
jgi:tetratricopeptide (TPR) repeat protein